MTDALRHRKVNKIPKETVAMQIAQNKRTRITFLSVHQVTGLIGLPQSEPFNFVDGLGSPDKRALLTMERDASYLHLRRVNAYGAVIVGMLTSNQTGAPWSDTFNRTLAGTHINDGVRRESPLLLIEVSDTIDELSPLPINDVGECSFGMRLFDQTKIASEAGRLLEDVASGISLTLTATSTPTLINVGHVAYATDPDSGRLLYSLEPSAHGSMTSSTSYEARALKDAAHMIQILIGQNELRTVVHLLARSVQTSDNMQSFLTAWAALEVFLNKTFRDTYKQWIYTKLSIHAAPSEQLFINRLREVIEGKYNVRDMFAVVASALTPFDADSDIELFKKLKAERDSIHNMSLKPNGYPAEATQLLIRKYLALHLLSVGS